MLVNQFMSRPSVMQAPENEKVVLFPKHSGSQELFEFAIVRNNAILI